MTQRGPKRKRPIDAERMTTTTFRLPAWLILKLDAMAAQMARETGVLSLNRSDLARKILSAAANDSGD